MKRKVRGEITKIGNLFDVYKKRLRAPQSSIVNEFVDVVHDLVGLKIAPETVSYSVHTKTLSLTISGMLKSEILMHKKDILLHLKGRLGEQNVPREII